MNKTVLITGSSKGLGKELSLVFADNGYNIILHGRDKNSLLILKNNILKSDVQCYVVNADLQNAKAIRKISRLAEGKNISILINNAAVHCPHLPLQKVSDAQIDNIITTNLSATIKLTREIYKLFLQEGGGTIININSISGLKRQKLRSVYSSSKWGLRGFTESFRLEAKENNVRVIDIYPSRIKTKPAFRKGMDTREVAKKIYNVYRHTKSERKVFDERKVIK